MNVTIVMKYLHVPENITFWKKDLVMHKLLECVHSIV